MSISETVRIVRAFSYFSHLANIAEIRTTSGKCARAAAPPEHPGRDTLAETLSHARAAGFSRRLICVISSAGAQVSPVLTAHPTEVRRKSTMDREMEIAVAARPPRTRPACPRRKSRRATSSCAARC